MEASDDAPPVSPSMETKPAGVSFSVDVEEEEKKVEFSEYSSTTKKALRKVPKRYIKQTVDKDDNTSGGKDKKGLLKRIFGGDKRKESSQILDTSLENDGEAEDPVMTIFQSRNTQRVRFALEEGVESDEPKTKEKNLGVKQFMSRALFSSTKSSKKLKEEIEREVAELGGSLVWQSIETSTGSEVVYSKSSNKKQNSEPTPSFSEDPKIRSKHAKLLSKAKRAENHFRYEYAVKCYLKAVNMMKMAKYPEDYPTVTRTHELLNSAHQMLSSYNNSVRIVKLGIRHEDSGELVRALKMYTIAYRIRRDNLSRIHPSHVVLLNMLGSIQVKRGELKEAMLIYELALKDATVSISISETGENIQSPIGNLLAKSVTFREMGIINEHWGNLDMALEVYHKSLECVAEWKRNAQLGDDNDAGESNDSGNEASITSLEFSFSEFESDTGEVEVCLSSKKESRRSVSENKNVYESYFPSRLDDELDNNRSISKGQDNNTTISKDSYADMDIALTLHQIAQLHRKQGQFAEALDAFQVSLRGMKYSLGRVHPNVAAVLGNIGNLQKEMGNLDAAYITYQEVLGIESYRLGLSHPDVAITVSFSFTLLCFLRVSSMTLTLFCC
jgi:tetratricopeptide (TPR) repeat protein